LYVLPRWKIFAKKEYVGITEEKKFNNSSFNLTNSRVYVFFFQKEAVTKYIFIKRDSIISGKIYFVTAFFV